MAISARACTVGIVVCCLLLSALGNPVFIEDKLIGWKGETYRSDITSTATASIPLVQSISWQPRAFIHRNFLTDEECDHLIKLALKEMKRSSVVAQDGGSEIDPYRTSYGMFIQRNKDQVVERVERRVADWTHLPPVHQEDLQVLRYGFGQQYKPHLDSLDNDTPRVATVLLYLQDTEEGGETAFPRTGPADWTDPALPPALGPFSPCAEGHVAMKPKRGDALLFWSIMPDGHTEDPMSEHTGCPVTKGIKYTGTVWIHSQPFRPESYGQAEEPFQDPGWCEDFDESCSTWAHKGECKNNPKFMIGDVNDTNAGMCRKACGVCESCSSKRDITCYNTNRKAAGFLELTEEEFNIVHGEEKAAI